MGISQYTSYIFIPTYIRTCRYNLMRTYDENFSTSFTSVYSKTVISCFIHSFVLYTHTHRLLTYICYMEALFSVCIDIFHIKVFYGEVGRNVIVFGSPPQFIFYRCRYRLYFLFVCIIIVILFCFFA